MFLIWNHMTTFEYIMARKTEDTRQQFTKVIKADQHLDQPGKEAGKPTEDLI